jgi:peptidyl-tRNA hydrolase
VMQIIVRGDLKEVSRLPRYLFELIVMQKHGYTAGPLMAQAAHAATAILHLQHDRDEAKEYLEDWQNMRKSIMMVS